MKILFSMFLVLSAQSVFASNSGAFPVNVTCIPWGYSSAGESLEHFTLSIDKNGNYQAKEEWNIPGTYSHSGKAFSVKASPGWVKLELLQEDSYFPKTRGFIKIQTQPSNESFVTTYKAVFSNDESAYLWESKKIACSVRP